MNKYHKQYKGKSKMHLQNICDHVLKNKIIINNDIDKNKCDTQIITIALILEEMNLTFQIFCLVQMEMRKYIFIFFYNIMFAMKVILHQFHLHPPNQRVNLMVLHIEIV